MKPAIQWALLGACASLLLLACSNSHGPNAGTSGSNWLKCAKLSDCRAAEQAVACNAEGFCVDARGERIAEGEPDPRKPDAGAPLGGGPVSPSTPCIWGTNALLALVGAEEVERRNCGRYPSFDAKGVRGGFECFGRTAVRSVAVELSVNECADCSILMTSVSTPSRGMLMIRRERDAFGADDVFEVSVQDCGGLDVDEQGGSSTLVCVVPLDYYYRCSEPASEVVEEEPQLPVDPLKLGDVSADGSVASETLHLYVNNQAFTEQSVDIDVYIDDQHVVTGDFDVGGPNDWFETEVAVPAGTHEIRISSRTADVDLDRTISVPAERWAVIDYWNEPPEGPRFTFNLHDEPVTFE